MAYNLQQQLSACNSAFYSSDGHNRHMNLSAKISIATTTNSTKHGLTKHGLSQGFLATPTGGKIQSLPTYSRVAVLY
jgi:hypothetical protein